MSRQRLTDTDHRILDVLTRRVRIAAEAQLEAAYGAGVPRRLAALRRRGFVSRASIAVRQIVVEGPLLVWSPGEPVPIAGPLAWKLQKRWTGLAPVVATLWWANAPAARLMGGVGGRLRQPLQVAHDLGVAAIYCRGGEGENPYESWIGEDLYRREHRPRRGEKVADAVLLGEDGEVERVIEFGGAYPARRVREFHRYWSRRQVPYELW